MDNKIIERIKPFARSISCHNCIYIRELERLERLAVELKILTGYNMEQLKTLFLQGFTLKKPESIDIEKILK